VSDDAAPVSMAVAPDRPRRLVYLGTPDVGVAPLRALVAAGFDVALVVTRPDKRRGRGGGLQPSPVKAAALDLGLTVTEQLDDALAVGAELGVVVAFGRIIPRRVLEQLPMVNIHFSLLPRWRGAAPVERALLAGDERTGVCLMEVAEGLDTGGVYAVTETDIGPTDTLDSLRGRLVELGSELLVSRLTDGLGEPTPQAGEPTYASKLEAADYELDWSRPAAELDRLVRLGGARTSFRDAGLKIWHGRPEGSEAWLVADAAPGTLVAPAGGGRSLAICTGAGVLVPEVVQPEGRGRQEVAAWRNGARPEPGEVLGR
jgi:methionyl-tRNA formyltransferase